MTGEFRKDLVSGQWVLIAPGRVGRPHAPGGPGGARAGQSRDTCPFEYPERSGHGQPVLVSRGVRVFPNKFPAVVRGACGEPVLQGPFLTHPAHGFHEVVITPDHDRTFAQFTDQETAEVLHAFRERYRQIARDECGDYISIFHNWGPTAGASITHSHSQIISTPVIPPEVLASIQGADEYFRQNGTSVHCRLIAWEVQESKRILFENDTCIVFCPFVSKTPYEVLIFPKRHSPRFEDASDRELSGCAQALNTALRAIRDALGDPDLNFYIHTAPVAKDPAISYDYYHWHIEIVPRISVAAGFELGTAVWINAVDPDDAAAELRKAIAK